MDRLTEWKKRILAALADFQAASDAERPVFERLIAATDAQDYAAVRRIQDEWMALRRTTDAKMEALKRAHEPLDTDNVR
ncbi:hypothetical protein ACL598_17025 [Bordetella bronchialis]|uniref:hypothetical protein n=1 Tax=Bordetella bronchialis TaxID=463025 RepID=UPI003D058CAA